MKEPAGVPILDLTRYDDALKREISASIETVYASGRFDPASALFERMMTNEEFTEFMTLAAYELID